MGRGRVDLGVRAPLAPDGVGARMLEPAGDGFRALFAANPLAMWVYDRETLAFLEVNDAALRLYGYSRDEFLQLAVTDLRPLDDAEREHERIARIESPFLEPGDVRHRMKDRGAVWVHVDAQDLDFGGRPARLCTVTDITARRAEADRATHLAAIIESSEDAITARDREGRIIVWNPAAERLYGYAASELLGTRATFLEPSDRPGEIAELVQRALGGEHVRAETVRLTKSGQRVDVIIWIVPVADPDGRPLGIAALHRDISQRKQRVEEIRRLISILDATPDFVGTADPEGNVLYLNRAARKMLGLHENESIAGRRLVQDHPAWVLPTVLEGLGVALERGAWEGESAVLRRDGRVTPTSQVILVHRGPEGRVRYFSTIARDITVRRQAQTALLDRTHQLATLLDVSYNVSSELDLEPLLGLILDQLKTVVDYGAAAILVLEEGALAVREYRGASPREEMLGLRFRGDDMRAYDALLQGSVPVVDDDLTDEARTHACDPQLLLGAWPDARSFLGVPLQVKGRTIGLFCIDHAEPARFSAHDAELTLAIATHAALAIEHARLYGQAQAFAVAEERQRLARELHDSISQVLFAIGFGAHAAGPLVDSDPDRAKEAIENIRSLSAAGLTEMRALIFELRPESLEREGLVAALGRQQVLLEVRHGIKVDLRLGPEPSVSLHAKEVLYRVAREALQNVVKHAHAGQVCVSLEQTSAGSVMEVTDDGIGFDPTAAFPGHLGLQSMRERAARLGATVEIASEPGRGTTVRIRVPKPAEEAGMRADAPDA